MGTHEKFKQKQLDGVTEVICLFQSAFSQNGCEAFQQFRTNIGSPPPHPPPPSRKGPRAATLQGKWDVNIPFCRLSQKNYKKSKIMWLVKGGVSANKISQKLHELEKIQSVGGARRSAPTRLENRFCNE